MEPRHFEFGPFALDADRGVLSRDGAPVDAGHRAVRLLQALLRAEGRVLTKAELLDAAWPKVDQLSQWNVLEQLEHVKSYPCVAKALGAGTVRLHAWWWRRSRCRAAVA